jgi:hypothetical protein
MWGVEGVVLEDHGDVAVFGGDGVDDAFADGDGAGGDVLQAGDHAEGGGLATARGADEDDELTVGDVEVDALDDAGAALVDLLDGVEGDLCQGDLRWETDCW